MKSKMIRTKRGLLAPKDYFIAPQSLIDEATNGCGPEGWKEKVVPETNWGLSMTPACLIHDWQYHFGKTMKDKEYADKVFLDNLNTIIDNKGGNRLIVWLRKRRAKTYYLAVSKFGDDAFKNAA